MGIKASCETCPHRKPMDKNYWDKVAKAQREATPDLSRKENVRLTRIERRIFSGLEANVPNCSGYSQVRAVANYFLSKVSVGHKIKTTEAGGTRLASWHERTCNNPFLESEEYFALQDEFDAVGSEDNGPFKTAKQRGAFVAGQAAMVRAMTGVVVMTGSGVVAQEANFPGDSVLVSGLLVGGGYLGVTGLWRSLTSSRTELQEYRNN